jgi:hypothetical protein
MGDAKLEALLLRDSAKRRLAAPARLTRKALEAVRTDGSVFERAIAVLGFHWAANVSVAV